MGVHKFLIASLRQDFANVLEIYTAHLNPMGSVHCRGPKSSLWAGRRPAVAEIDCWIFDGRFPKGIGLKGNQCCM